MTNNRFINNTLSELQKANHSPIFGYEDSSLLTLEETVEKIIPLISRAMDYVATARKNYNRHSTLLTPDESAVIYLYSMPTPFFSCLNNALRAENRDALKLWSTFLKLFISAIEKLPSTKATIWRGVNYDDTLSFVDNDVHVWWGINSCSMNLNIVQQFLSANGTLFAIDTVHGKDISAFSAIPDEKEVVLMPGTRVRRRHESLNFIDRLFIIHLEEIKRQSESQTESNYLFKQIKQEYQRHNRIERIINPSKSFPIEQSYINLAIVKVKEQHEKEKQLRDAKHSNDIISAFEEIYGMKTAIDVKDIFDTCKTQEKQVLVFGRAGIGKSTFSRYVAYQWATNSYWPQYELLALIPLRRLTANRYPPLPFGQNYSLIDLVKKELFQYDLSEKENTLLKNQFDARKTLWILDGYDEIVQNVPPHLESLLEQLLKTPHHILTSRPYMNTLSYEVQMEITGFTDDNIPEYVQQFFDQMKDELGGASVKGQKLFEFLKSKPSIWGVAHIPINLELICSFWSNEDWSETKELTITKLYTIITEWLCQRYLTAQCVPIQKKRKNDVYRRCQKELAFLESLAFNAMESNTIILRPPLLERALNEAKVSLEDDSDILNIGILKSFNKQGTGIQIETSKDHYFIHLSFQEYFAARYLINTLNGSSNQRAIEFIKCQKYNQRYGLLFIFASGLLNESEVEPCLSIFWDAILREPLDLVGIRHIQLVISFIEEANDKSAVPWHSQLLEWIAKCIKHSITTKNEIICEHLSQSLRRAQSITCDQMILNAVIKLLEYDDTDLKTEVLSFISTLDISNPSSALIISVTTTLGDEDKDVRSNACEALGNIGEKAATNEVISKLVGALEDENEDVRRKACEALGNIGEKAATNEVISKLVGALEDENEDVRRKACEALGNIGEKAATNEVISKLVSALGDEKEYVRAIACEALGKIGEKAATNETISKLVSALEDENGDVRRKACEALQNIGEKAATNEMISKLVTALGDQNKLVRSSACEILGKIGENAATNEIISKLVSVLGDDHLYVRWSACEALENIGEKAATNEMISKLVGALEDENELVRSSACQVLGKIGEKAATNEVISKLVGALEDENEDVRRKACEALGNIGEKAATNEVISKLVSALGDEKEYVRWSAREALDDIGEQAATNEMISKLVSALEDENEDVRSSVCQLLGNIGEKAATNEVINKIVSALDDENKDVRSSACEALGNIGEKAATNEVISKLVRALEDENEDVEFSACEALGNIGEKAATNEVISELVSELGDWNEYIRAIACEALGNIGEKAATNEVISELVSALEDENEDVRSSACQALGNIGEKAATNEVISKLVSALEDENEDVRSSACQALGNIGEKAATNEVISELVSALEDENEDVRENARISLVTIGEKAATNETISKLVSALEDENEDVSGNACEVLGIIGEKAATNEVISKLILLINSDSKCSYRAVHAVESILSSSAVFTHLVPQIVSDLCLCKYASLCLENVSEAELIVFFLRTENPDWLPPVTQLAILKRVGVAVAEDEVVVYGSKEPLKLHVPSLQFRQELVKAFTNQAKELRLYFELPSEA